MARRAIARRAIATRKIGSLMVEYDQAYRGEPSYFGSDANPFLIDHCDQIRSAGRVLDVGIGQGRNGLELARRGFDVTGIDSSAAAIRATAERGKAEGLQLDLRQASFVDFDTDDRPFDGVLLFGLLQELERRAHGPLLHSLWNWTAPGGTLFLTAWHLDDPRYPELRRSATPIGSHSFRTATGQVRTYLERDEILTLLAPWTVVHHWEGLGPWHRHGDSQPERHGVIEVVARRNAVGRQDGTS
jgi:2-polyprenyl-3-methyl-5-hydroxy-6-metoxy-1,4-benzoquinol methylase